MSVSASLLLCYCYSAGKLVFVNCEKWSIHEVDCIIAPAPIASPIIQVPPPITPHPHRLSSVTWAGCEGSDRGKSGVCLAVNGRVLIAAYVDATRDSFQYRVCAAPVDIARSIPLTRTGAGAGQNPDMYVILLAQVFMNNDVCTN